MSEPYIGEIQLFSFDYAPKGWMLCQGQTLKIQEYAALYAIMGTTYGGDGKTTFMLPDLRGRSPVQFGIATSATSAYKQGAAVGAETVTITAATMPAHTHTVKASKQAATTAGGADNYFSKPVISAATQTEQSAYGPVTAGSTVTLNPGAVSSVGGGKGHNNMQPFLTLNYCIAVLGIFPPRN